MLELITENSNVFEGLESQLIEALKNNKKVRGRAWNKEENLSQIVWLKTYDYNLDYPYSCVLDNNKEYCYLNFKPFYKYEMNYEVLIVDEHHTEWINSFSELNKKIEGLNMMLNDDDDDEYKNIKIRKKIENINEKKINILNDLFITYDIQTNILENLFNHIKIGLKSEKQ